MCPVVAVGNPTLLPLGYGHAGVDGHMYICTYAHVLYVHTSFIHCSCTVHALVVCVLPVVVIVLVEFSV